MPRQEDHIAVFDSGLGGLSVLRELTKIMPHENFLYYGDSAHAPYGTKTTAQVRELTVQAIDALMPLGVKAVVIACNTATSAAIDTLRCRYPDTIVVGIEPAIKLAADHCPHGRIIVMATEVTLREEKFCHLMQPFQASHEILRLPCPRLVEFVEQGMLDGPEPEAYLREVLLPCVNDDTSSIVLGCTHFPFLRPLISQLTGGSIPIFDGGEGTAAHTMHCLKKVNLLRTEGDGSITIHNSLGTPEILQRSMNLLEMREQL